MGWLDTELDEIANNINKEDLMPKFKGLPVGSYKVKISEFKFGTTEKGSNYLHISFVDGKGNESSTRFYEDTKSKEQEDFCKSQVKSYILMANLKQPFERSKADRQMVGKSVYVFVKHSQHDGKKQVQVYADLLAWENNEDAGYTASNDLTNKTEDLDDKIPF